MKTVNKTASEQITAVMESNSKSMNELFAQLGLDMHDRYMGSFPYPDKDTGQPRVAWALSMRSQETRDGIVNKLNEAISRAELVDIEVLSEDENPDSNSKSRWPATLWIVAKGDSVTDVLAGAQLIQRMLFELNDLLN